MRATINRYCRFMGFSSFKVILTTCVVGSCLSLVGCSENEWMGFFYPNKNDLTVDEYLGVFTTLKACRDAAEARVEESQGVNSDYECALNCDTSKGKPYVCEKTER